MEELKESLRQCPDHIKAPWLNKSVSFRFVVEGFGRKIPDEEKLTLMDEVTDVCPFEVCSTCFAYKLFHAAFHLHDFHGVYSFNPAQILQYSFH